MKYEQVAKLVKATDPVIILNCANVCDGWTIFDSKLFVEKGLNEKIVNFFAMTHKSDPNPNNYKEQLTDKDGNKVHSCKGVYGLDLLKGLASMLGIEYEPKMGRGSQAGTIIEALHNALGVKT